MRGRQRLGDAAIVREPELEEADELRGHVHSRAAAEACAHRIGGEVGGPTGDALRRKRAGCVSEGVCLRAHHGSTCGSGAIDLGNGNQ